MKLKLENEKSTLNGCELWQINSHDFRCYSGFQNDFAFPHEITEIIDYI